jgi:hypothetical protein
VFIEEQKIKDDNAEDGDDSDGDDDGTYMHLYIYV